MVLLLRLTVGTMPALRSKEHDDEGEGRRSILHRNGQSAIPGCTISKAVHDGANDIICFSLARNTDISAEIYPYHKLIIMAEGVKRSTGQTALGGTSIPARALHNLTDTPMGTRTAEGAVYTEVSIRRSDIMNEAIKAGEVFGLA